LKLIFNYDIINIINFIIKPLGRFLMGTSSSLTSLSSSTLGSLAYASSQSAQASESQSAPVALSSPVAAVAAETLSAMASSMTSAMALSLASQSLSASGSIVQQLSLDETREVIQKEAAAEEAEALPREEAEMLIQGLFVNTITEKLEKEMAKTGKIRGNFCLILQNGASDATIQGLERVLSAATKLMPNEHIAVFNQLVEPAKGVVKAQLPIFQSYPLFNYAVDLAVKVAFIEGLPDVVNGVHALSPDYLKDSVEKDVTCKARKLQVAEKGDSKEQKSEKDEKKA
jgi:hypothetical protein